MSNKGRGMSRDTKYGHKIGSYKCSIRDCKGHTEKYKAAIHDLYGPGKRRGRKKANEEAEVKKAVARKPRKRRSRKK